MTFRFRGDDGPLANARFRVEGSALPTDGTTDGDGKVELTVAAHVTELELSFPELDRSFTVRVGHMDPVDEMSGVRSRLMHLGYLLPHPSEILAVPRELYQGLEDDATARLERALRAFQQDKGLAPTGALDDATRAALTDAHGS
ncbi:MAG: peptidoglycan-binding domain-containing protein [Minicystis sp.]